MRNLRTSASLSILTKSVQRTFYSVVLRSERCFQELKRKFKKSLRGLIYGADLLWHLDLIRQVGQKIWMKVDDSLKLTLSCFEELHSQK